MNPLSYLRALAVAAGCGLLVWLTAEVTGERIAAARSAALQAKLAVLVGPLRANTIDQPLQLPLALCEGQTLIEAEGRGYGGPLRLLLALSAEGSGTVRALAVQSHEETPGIGDFIDDAGAESWLTRFVGQNAASLAERPFGVDAVAGATITVRAVRRAISAALTAPVAFDDQPCPRGPADV